MNENPTTKATSRVESSRALELLVRHINDQIDLIVQHEYEVAQWSGELISIALVREATRQMVCDQLMSNVDEYIPTPIMPATARVVIDDETFYEMIEACEGCYDMSFTHCPDHDVYTFCDEHDGWTKIKSAHTSTGFAGGRIDHAELACGCVLHDESDDVAAAR